MARQDEPDPGGDLTLADGYGDVDFTPRRILAACLKRIAARRQDEAWRRAPLRR